MKTRVLAAMVFVPLLFVVFLFVPKLITAIFVGIMAAVASYELLHNTGVLRDKRVNCYASVFAFSISIWSFYGCPQIYGLLGVLVFYVLIFSEIMVSGLKIESKEILLCTFAALIVPYMLSALVRIVMMEQGRVYIFVPFLVAFLSDSGGYFAGITLGKHKLCPLISPKKTVEGFIGGVFAAIAGMIVFKLIVDSDMTWGFTLVMGLLGSLGGVFGDLSMSAIKRQAQIKDFGRLIPGHGGILDRFDSVLVTAPLTELILMLLLKV